MPTLLCLKLQHFRNFKEAHWDLQAGLNVIIGPNGAGKTSILEALYFLSHGRSFRAKELNRLVHHQETQFTVFAEAEDEDEKLQLAMQRSLHGDNKNRLNHVDLKSASQLAERLPVLLFNPESFELLGGGPKYRRYLMDWGVFYHEPLLRSHYLNVKRAIKQRNAALKQNLPREHIRLWENTCFDSIQKISAARAHYLEVLFQKVQLLLKDFVEEHQLVFRYDQGWPEGEDLQTLWDKSFAQDLRLGSTQYGPHQADLKMLSLKKPAKDLLSRGQQKLLISILKLAQGQLLQEQLSKTPIYLLDDLASELDTPHQDFLWNYLLSQNAQVILTHIHQDQLKLPLSHYHRICL